MAEVYSKDGSVKGYPDPPTSQIHGPDGSGTRTDDIVIPQDPIYGIEWDQGNDTWTHIDASGNSITLDDTDFSSHSIWGGIQRVNLNADGTIAAEWGDSGYEHTPSSVSTNVMVQYPKFWYKFNEPSTGVYRFWVASYAADGFTLFPWFNQGNGSADYKYRSAYEAADDGSQLYSHSGVTPQIDQDIIAFRNDAQAIGANWQQSTIWGYAAHKLLSMIYLGSMDSQSIVGEGITDGTYSSAQNTGMDGMDDQITEANLGTAMGTGTNGATPICMLWEENTWGNIRTFVDGYEAVDSEYRILLRDGSWATIGPDGWTSSDYETSSANPLTDSDGYIDDIESEELLAILGIPSSVSGSDSTYIPDYLYSHDSGENNILGVGGGWDGGLRAGLSSLYSRVGVALSASALGARLEFIG